MSKNKGFSAIVLIIILAILAGGGYAVWQKEDSNNKVPPPVINTDEQIDIANNTDISDWQTYRNEEYGFEFQYPEDWEACPIYVDHIAGTKNLVCLKDMFSSSKLFVLTEDKELKNISTLSELKKYYDNYSRLLIEERDIGQFKFLTVGNCIGGCSYGNYIFLPSGQLIDFGFVDFVENDRINDDIISTLKFTK